MSAEIREVDKQVELFHGSLIWPLQLEPLAVDEAEGRHWEVFGAMKGLPWTRLDDEFTADSTQFKERHYREFVSFLPYVQRFLYGEGRSRRQFAGGPPGDSPVHIYRRKDIVNLRLTLRPGDEPVNLHIVHLDIYFFHDLDLAVLNLEVRGDDLPLDTVRDVLFRFGRAYPSGWDEDGRGLHNVHLAEWLGADGQVIAVSDAERRSMILLEMLSKPMPMRIDTASLLVNGSLPPDRISPHAGDGLSSH